MTAALLRERQADIRRSHAQRIHAGTEGGFDQEVQGVGNPRVPVRESAGEKAGRWGVGLTAAKKADCRWLLRPVLMGQFEFVEWTQDKHSGHSRFVGLREDKKAMDVRRE
jgi:hypothetical protein